ncbi:MAG: squalene--hopene cyclase [Verrucomicrobia bacterium]|nr:squalene--hopene cyclase [Verrucomicrobiota bacterium]
MRRVFPIDPPVAYVSQNFAQIVQTQHVTRRAAWTAAKRAAEFLVELQKPEGYWCGELLADVSLEADYIVLEHWLHRRARPMPAPLPESRLRKACRRICSQMLPSGGWPIYPGGPADVNVSVKAYTALRLAGYPADHPILDLTCRKILAFGGLQACNSYTRINLSLLGLFPKKFAPTIPPEIIFLPGGNFYPGGVLYEMASWTRAIIIPLSIVQAVGGVRAGSGDLTLDELYDPKAKLAVPKRDHILALFFHQLDKFFKVWERRGLREVRIAAVRQAERWMIERCRNSDGLGAIYPAMMYTIMALDALDYPPDHPAALEARHQFEKLMTERDEDLYFQPCFSPIWDTAYASFVLGESGLVSQETLRKAGDWMLSKEVRHRGDWVTKRPHLPPSGWSFEFLNDHYPDIDDTAMVLLGLMHARGSDADKQARIEARAVTWLRGMQSRDGGYAAFDADNDWNLLNSVPFSDHNAMLDPTCADITGRVLECLARRRVLLRDPSIWRGLRWLLRTQRADGSWYGRWGVAYIYGTFLALRGLRFADCDERNVFEKGANFLIDAQNRDGGWGESCASYCVDRFVGGQSTPSQTAWALLGLAAAQRTHIPAFQSGIRYLIETQQADGTWPEALATGTGFPNVFYLRYTLYAQYFPLWVLSVYAKHQTTDPSR